MTSPLTNTRSGSFHKLELLNGSGDFQDVLSMIAAGGAGITTLTAAGGGIVISGSGTSRTLTVDLSALATSSSVTTLLANYVLTSAFNSALAAKQATLTATTDIACQDVACRNITANAAAMTIKGGVITLIQDSAAATAIEIQAAFVGINKSLNLYEPTNVYKAASFTNTSASLTGALYVGAGNVPTWNAVPIITTTSLNAKVVSAFSFDYGLSAVTNASNGTLIASINSSFLHPRLHFTNTTKTLRCIVQNSAENLCWNDEALATTVQLAAQNTALTAVLNTKQPILAFIAENPHTDNNFIQTNEASNTFLSWGSGTYSNVGGSHQVLTMAAGLYEMITATGTTAPLYLSAEFRAGTCNEILLAVNNSAAWAGYQEIKVSGLSTTKWRSVSWIVDVYPTALMNLHAGIVPTGSSSTQAGGTVHMRNLHVWRPVGGVAMSKQLAITGNLDVSEAIECIAVHQKSDRALKEDIVPVNLQTIQKVFDAVSVQTYRRIDGPIGSRIGFIAQDMDEALEGTGFDNIVARTRDGRNHRTIDHSRLSAILWAQCKNLQQRIEALEAKQRPTKTTTKAKT